MLSSEENALEARTENLGTIPPAPSRRDPEALRRYSVSLQATARALWEDRLAPPSR